MDDLLDFGSGELAEIKLEGSIKNGDLYLSKKDAAAIMNWVRERWFAIGQAEGWVTISEG
jgi:hypothetical protein